jgi:hypothetical protein
MTKNIVTPAKAGVHLSASAIAEPWIPAFAGMTTVIIEIVEANA